LCDLYDYNLRERTDSAFFPLIYVYFPWFHLSVIFQLLTSGG
jgi:hypothetical protein